MQILGIPSLAISNKLSGGWSVPVDDERNLAGNQDWFR
jgi:hypothetical protein